MMLGSSASLLRLNSKRLSVLGKTSSRSISVWSDRVNEKRPCMTKIVATIGPASEDEVNMQNIVSAGMRVMRVNFSHATFEEFDLRKTNLTKTKGVHGGDFNLRAVLLDTQGPEIRTGSSCSSVGKDFTMEKGETCILTTDEKDRNSCTPNRMFVTYNKIAEAVKPGNIVLLDDGLVGLKVQKILENGEVECLIENTGPMSSKKGVNLPGAKVDIPAMSDKDKTDIEYGIQNDIDYIAASFVRKPEDVQEIRDFVSPLVEKYFSKDHPLPKIISKIESTEAIVNFDEILDISDGIMVARGDLGVEIPLAQLTNAQKVMVQKCNLVGKPVIVATQMLESMQKNPRPTRAEVADVTNAVHDGADAVMLSGESAKGKYPVQSVSMMNEIIDEAERWIAKKSTDIAPTPKDPSNHLESVCHAAVQCSKSLNAECIIVLTKKGSSAEAVAKYRPECPIMSFTPSAKVGRQLILSRGIHPVVETDIGLGLDNNSIITKAIAKAKQMGFAKPGSSVVVVCSEPASESTQAVMAFRAVKVQ